MTLGQLILLILVVVTFWLGKKLKKQESKLRSLEDKLDKK